MATKLTITVWQGANGAIYETEEEADRADREYANEPRALLHGVLNGDPEAERKARELLYGKAERA